MSFLYGKRFLITGIASKLSIAYGIAQIMYKYGAQLSFTYQGEKIKDRVKKIAAEFDSNIVIKCDVSDDMSIKQLFIKLSNVWKTFDGFIHSIAFAPNDQLNGDYINNITREGFKISHDISSYSFVAMAKECRSLLNKGSGLLTISYLGSERVIPNYNVMGLAKASLESNVRYMANTLGPEGIRVNAISAGPVKTLASSGIKNFRKMLNYYEKVTPIRRAITIQDIGKSSAFICSDLASGITGEIIHVDGGFNIASMVDI